MRCTEPSTVEDRPELTTKLAASRAFWPTAYPAQSHEMLFDAHARAFATFGGVPRRGIYECKGVPCS
jgi:hypothetical protein